MRSSHLIPGNPWPHDMVIRVEDDPEPLLELLWIREAWALAPEGDDLPPALADTPAAVAAKLRAAAEATVAEASSSPAAAAPAPLGEWQQAWPELWRACLQHAGTPGQETFDRMQASAAGSPERMRLIRELRGPTWRERFGRDAFTAEYDDWKRERFERLAYRPPRRLEESPERIALDALIPVWEAGLTTVVQLPCRGSYTRVIRPHGLALTAETRADPARYREALATFR